MPLLNSRDTVLSNALTSNRAAQIQLDLLKRDVHAMRRSGSPTDAARMMTPSTERPGAASSLSGDAVVWRPNASSRASTSSAAELLRSECGNPGCKAGWIPPWRSRRYPFFEDRWACSQACLLIMVKMAVARELGDGSVGVHDAPAPGEAHRHRVPLGLVMLAQGWVTHPQLRKALEMQRLRGKGRIGEWLVAECGLNSEWVTRGLSVQWNCPVLTTEGFSPETMARAIPKPLIEEYGILPVRLAGRRILYVGFRDQIDASSAFAMERISGMRTECGVVNEEKYAKAKDAVLACRGAELRQTIVSDRDALARSIQRAIAQGKPGASRLVRLHRYFWLRLWHEEEENSRGGRTVPAAGEAADYLYTIGS